MANGITGNFDVVAEFAVPAVNRLLAAMHAAERFAHTMSLRVKDVPVLPGSKTDGLSVIGVVDTFGDPTVDHTRIARPFTLAGQFKATDLVTATLDPLINTDAVVHPTGGILEPPAEPSHLQGVAQLQLSAPTIQIDGSGTHMIARFEVMARYLADPHTSPVAKFIHAELRITAAVNQVVTQTAHVININIKANTVGINFNPIWSDRILSAEDIAAIQRLIRNALKTSFLPSNATLPSEIGFMQFKTLHQAQDAIAVMLNLNGPHGNPATMSTVFLNAGDDFAFAIGVEFVRTSMSKITQNIKSQNFGDFSVDSLTVDLEPGKIVLTISGPGSWWGFSFHYKATIPLTLVPSGSTAEVAAAGDVSLQTGDSVAGYVFNAFTEFAKPKIRAARDTALSNSMNQDAVRKAASADALQGFLKSLLNPANQSLAVLFNENELIPQLRYTAVSIEATAIILHGTLSVLRSAGPVIFDDAFSNGGSGQALTEWPLPHVEFERIPSDNTQGEVTPPGPDYSALKSWIPGGTITSFEWSHQGQPQPFFIEHHKFVLIHPPPEFTDGSSGPVGGYGPLCLTVRGSRLSSHGPVVSVPVSAKVCRNTAFPIIDLSRFSILEATPLVVISRPNSRGQLEIVGHAAAQVDENGTGTPNLIVHFANDRSVDQLEVLAAALRESKRTDTAAAILAVLTPEQMARARHVDGVIYSESQGGVWERAFNVRNVRHPLTLIVGPKGDVAWQQDGEIDREKLAGALRKNLISGATFKRSMLSLNLRMGHPAPNFLFEFAPGQQLTLRKLAKKPVILVFWKSSSKQSVAAVRDVEGQTRKYGEPEPVVLAINDGESAEVAKRTAAEHRFSATVVMDPKREISGFYGVNIWPTLVFIDASGLVRTIQYGHSHV